MFTGLIQAMGTVAATHPDRLRVHWHDIDTAIRADLEVGDSVAVDGVCLTVVAATEEGFWADVSPETLTRSTLGRHSPSHCVNLERSLRVGAKVGGHFVTGHIDGVGSLCEVKETGSAWELSFRVPETVARYVVHKGSIAINGISLTVAAVADRGSWFSVAVIPHTFTSTNLALLNAGDTVNLEGDILGKYVEKFLSGREGSGATVATEAELSFNFLAEHGYV
jgi:riboflavin synthase